MHAVLMEMLGETGNCEIERGAALAGAVAEEGTARSITLTNGREVTARWYIDGTGDGLLCAACGCERLRGADPRTRFRESDAPVVATDSVNGVTLIYRVRAGQPEQIEPLPSGIPEHCWWQDVPPPACVNHYPNGDRNINMLPSMTGTEFVRLGMDAAYAECKRRIHCHWHFIQTHFPEFRRFRIDWTAPLLGIREGWRTVCEKMLTQNDIQQGLSRQTDTDIIAVADHALDVHGAASRCPELDEPYGIPYRCLIPRGMENLLVACRGAGFSQIAASSCRLSRTMMQLGQAAGTAVALAREHGTTLPAVDPEALRASLRAQHVQLEWPIRPDLAAYLQSEAKPRGGSS